MKAPGGADPGASAGSATSASTPATVAGVRTTVRGDVRGDPIASGLRQLWADVEREPVPEEFLDMLDRIDSAIDAGRTGPEGGPRDGQPG
jgi:hypothetical protein